MLIFIKIKLFFVTLFHNLWLSISSPKFYSDVYNKYTGYGVKYIFSLSVISSFIISVILLSYTTDINQYLKTRVVNSKSILLDKVITQLPDIKYYNGEISTHNKAPFYIKDNKNNPILIIDTENSITPAQRSNTYLLLTKNKIIVNALDRKRSSKTTVPIKYQDILGNDAITISQNNIHSILHSIFTPLIRTVIYMGLPLLSMLTLLQYLTNKILLCIVIFVIFKIKHNNTKLKDCFRVVIFSNGISALLYFPVALMVNQFSVIITILEILATIMMILGISGYKSLQFKK